jgi:hypothetical protein
MGREPKRYSESAHEFLTSWLSRSVFIRKRVVNGSGLNKCIFRIFNMHLFSPDPFHVVEVRDSSGQMVKRCALYQLMNRNVPLQYRFVEFLEGFPKGT